MGGLELDAQIGVYRAAMLTLFCAFSANARGLIRTDHENPVAAGLLRNHLLLLLPAVAIAGFKAGARAED